MATEMDGEYRDAWLYLGIANLKAAQNLEIKTDDKAQYLSRAKDSLARAISIDPNYDKTIEYVRELDSYKI